MLEPFLKKILIHYIVSFVVLITAVTTLPYNSFAGTQNEISVSIDSVEGKRDQMVDVPISVGQQFKGIASYGMKVNFDSTALEVVSITSMHGNTDDTFCVSDEEGCFVSNFNNTDGWVKAAWVDSSGGDHPILNGKVLYSIKFKIKTNSSIGQKPITISTMSNEDLLLTDSNNHTLSSSVIAGKVTVLNNEPPTGNKVEEILVDVEGSSSNQNETVIQLPVKRTTEANGKVIDEVNFTPERVVETLKKIGELGGNTARIILPDKQDTISEVNVNVPQQAVKNLANEDVNLEIFTESTKISIPTSTLSTFQEDLYFRIVPIKKENEKEEIKTRALKEEIVKEVSEEKDVTVLGRPMVIETNMENRPVTLTLPFSKNVLPTNEKEKEKFLKNLVIYIEHDDGTKEFVQGKLTVYSNGEPGITFDINKFSTFTMLYIENFANENPNIAPNAEKLKVHGNVMVNSTLTGQYSFKDQNNDLQGKSTFKWYRADDSKGKNKKVIPGAVNSTYKLVATDKGKFIGFEVTPIAKTGTIKGKAVKSTFVGPVKPPNSAPVAKNVKIEGIASEKSKLTVNYLYQDTEKDTQGVSVIKWYRVEPKTKVKQLISGANKATYVLTAKDVGKSLMVEITPVAKTGTKTGKVVTSTPTQVVKAVPKLNGHFKLGVIKDKTYVEKLSSIIKNTYKGSNVVIKKEGSNYRLFADFVDKKRAQQVGDEMKRKKLIVDYYVY